MICRLRRKPGQIIAHLVDLTTRVQGRTVDVDSADYTDPNPVLRNVQLALPLAQAPTGVRVVPALATVRSAYAEGVLRLSVGVLPTHAAVIIDVPGDEAPGLLPVDWPLPAADFHPESRRGGVLIAEDFEKYAVGATPERPWAAEMKPGTPIEVTDQNPASGSRCLKLTDTVGSSFWPYLHHSVPAYRRGASRLEFDIRLEPRGQCLLEVRYEGKGAGPCVRFDGDGTVWAAGRGDLTTLPTGEWCHVVVDYTLGTPEASYSLSLTPQGGETQEFAGLGYATDWFYLCDSVYFVGSGEAEGAFYLDNIHLERLAP